MDLRVFLDDIFLELPNEYYSDITFSSYVTSIVLSSLGHFLAVGFEDGSVILCDSETGNNRHRITGHDTVVSSVSLSSNNRKVASGDENGLVQVNEVVTGKLVYSHKFAEAIQSVSFNPVNDNLLLVHTGGTAEVVEIDSGKESKVSDGVILSRWIEFTVQGEKECRMIFIDESLNMHFLNDSLEPCECCSFKSMKKIIFMAVSNNGKFICIINGRGEGYMYDTDDLLEAGGTEPHFITMYKDMVTETKYTCCVFDRYNSHVIFSSNQRKQCKLVIFDTGATEFKQELDGEPEKVNFLLFHPQQPVIFSCGSESIRIWTPTYQNSWEQFMPGFKHLDTNVEYQEREDEFDIDDSVHVDTIMREEGEEINFECNEDDTVLVDLPLNIDEIVESRVWETAKEEKKEENE